MGVKKKFLPYKKKFQKGTKKSSSSGGFPKKLTRIQEEILYCLTEEYMTPLSIARRRNCGVRAVNKHIKIIKDLGLLNRYFEKVPKNVCTPGIPPLNIRLHGEEYNLKILFQDYKYRQLKERTNKLIIDDNTITLHKNSIKIYSHNDFFGETADGAEARSCKYWLSFFIKLENKLNIDLVKRNSENIKRVKAHYADINNSLAKLAIKKNQIVKINGQDGKVWLLIDNSNDNPELETTHPQDSMHDMQETVGPFFNDLRNNNPPRNSELANFIEKTQTQIQELTQSQIYTQKQLQQLLTILTPNQKEEVRKIEKLDYFG